MKLTAIVNTINRKLAGEQLEMEELLPYLDDVMDTINTTLNSTFPVFSDLETGVLEYDMIPDKYIRSVVVPGACWKFYTSDEEGEAAAPQFQQDYNTGLFYMLRDYSSMIPEEYQADQTGFISFEVEELTGARGLEIDGNFLI